MRVELDPEFQAPFTGDVPQLIAEYAVDLQFGLTVQDDMINGTNVYLPEDSGALLDYADVPHNTATSGKAGPYGPHLIRGVHARLAVRTRLADYQSPLLTNLTGVTSADLHRVAVATGEYARLRSLQAHIATRNTRTETWQ